MKNKIIERALFCVMAICSGVVLGMDEFVLPAPVRTTQLSYSVIEVNQKTKELELFGLSYDAGEQTLKMYPKDKPYKSFLLTLGDVRVIKNTLDDLEGKDFNVCVQPYVFRIEEDAVTLDKITYQKQECLVNRKDFYTAYHQLFPVQNGSKAKKLSQIPSQIVSKSNNQEECDLSFLHENDNPECRVKAPELSMGQFRSYGNIYCSLPSTIKHAPVPATIGVCPTNSYQLQIVPMANPNQKIEGTWMLNRYALQLDGTMMDCIDREIKQLLRQNSDATRCVIALTESSSNGHRSLFYEIDIQSYCDQYKALLAQEEDRKERIQEATKSRAALQLTEEEKKEEPSKTKTWNTRAIFAGAITIGGGFALFVYMLHRMGYLSTALNF